MIPVFKFGGSGQRTFPAGQSAVARRRAMRIIALSMSAEPELRPIREIAERAGILPDELEPYGRHKAKVSLSVIERTASRPRGLYVLVTAISPTPLGEGKTTTTIGLAQAFQRLGKKAIATVRQSSMGPVFGIKGGGTGGGASQVIPLSDTNLHLTGDFHAISAANNLLAAWIDTTVLLKNPLGIRPESITWRRVVDMNDRALREITIGQGGPENGVERKTGFDITAASEVMACWALASDPADLRARLARIVVAEDGPGNPVTAERLGAAGAMAALLVDAMKPNLLQTTEGTPCLVHAGPFANIAHGNSSVVADRIAAGLADVVVTEAGFGADMGAEKFFNIKCRASGLWPDAAVVVASVRALKMHGLSVAVKPGKPLPKELVEENLEALDKGCANLDKQIENVLAYGVPVVVAVNRFPGDTPREMEFILGRARKAGAVEAAASDVFARGGAGGEDLARAVLRAASPSGARRPAPQFLYPDDWPLERKIDMIARRMYGASGVEYTEGAKTALARLARWGFSGLPICMAKTQYSLSHDPQLRGRPEGFILPVREVRLSAGAGFVTPVSGKIQLMPGLGSTPSLLKMDVDAAGNITGF